MLRMRFLAMSQIWLERGVSWFVDKLLWKEGGRREKEKKSVFESSQVLP